MAAGRSAIRPHDRGGPGQPRPQRALGRVGRCSWEV